MAHSSAYVIMSRKSHMLRFARAHGIKIPPSYMTLWPHFGAASVYVLKEIQKALKQTQTGVWDAKLQDALFVRVPDPQHLRVLALALSQVGVKESPPNSNSGPKVHEYQSTTGAYGQAWCASFAKWLLVRCGASQAQLAHATADVTTWLAYPHMSAANVRPGDQVIYQWGGGDVDHIGTFYRWILKGHSFQAVEGNTSVGNDSNGGEVMVRTRSVSSVAAFVRVAT